MDFIRPLQRVGNHAEIDQTASISLLRKPELAEYIDEVREREGIMPPETRDELDENLANHPPEALLADATAFAETFWSRAVEEVFRPHIEKHVLPVVLPMVQMMNKPIPDDPVKEMVNSILDLPTLVRNTGRIIARHIVTGFFEIPQALGTPGSGVTVATFPDGTRFLVAMISGIDTLESVVTDIRQKAKEVFVEGERQRLPNLWVETAWFCYYRDWLISHGEDEILIYVTLAELSFEADPQRCPPATASKGEREAAVRVEAERIRKNCENHDASAGDIFYRMLDGKHPTPKPES